MISTNGLVRGAANSVIAVEIQLLIIMIITNETIMDVVFVLHLYQAIRECIQAITVSPLYHILIK
jgi:hypothetical protein